MTTRCHACGRPLRDPISVAAGIGPRCAEQTARAEEPSMFVAAYVAESIDGVLVFFDRAGAIDVLDDMPRALATERLRLGEHMPDVSIARDRAGGWWIVRHRRGAFGGVAPIGNASIATAISIARTGGGHV